MITIIIVLVTIITYLLTGAWLAVRNISRAWERSRKEWSAIDTRSVVKHMTIFMFLGWPVYGGFLILSKGLNTLIDSNDPEILRRKLREQDNEIARLEREAGLR